MRQWRSIIPPGLAPGGMIRNERQSGNFQSPLSRRMTGPTTTGVAITRRLAQRRQNLRGDAWQYHFEPVRNFG
jgi:hypothetical protein